MTRRRSSVPMTTMAEPDDLLELVQAGRLTDDVEGWYKIREGAARAITIMFNRFVRESFSHPKILKIKTMRTSVDIDSRYTGNDIDWKLAISSHIHFIIGNTTITDKITVRVYKTKPGSTDEELRNANNSYVDVWDYMWWHYNTTPEERTELKKELKEQLIRIVSDFIGYVGMTVKHVPKDPETHYGTDSYKVVPL